MNTNMTKKYVTLQPQNYTRKDNGVGLLLARIHRKKSYGTTFKYKLEMPLPNNTFTNK